ncbi:MAG: transcription termination/antitermination protein NusG [Lachnospiraceae bacterium]|nr:transcription termination/antitermination protein NusG [Lachnospiraceae bacterium]
MSEAAETEAKWYVVHTYSGYENKVRNTIMQTVQNRGIEDLILEVAVPLEIDTEYKDGQTKAVERKMLPGYVLVHMVMNDDTWYVVRNTRGVTGFVGPGSKPVPLTEAEMKNLGIKETKKSDTIVSEFEVGDTVQVIAGAWKGTVGIVKAVNAPKESATITVDMFGRETPVEISFSEIQHLA